MPSRFPVFFCLGIAGLPCKMYFIPEHPATVKPLIADLLCEFSGAENCLPRRRMQSVFPVADQIG